MEWVGFIFSIVVLGFLVPLIYSRLKAEERIKELQKDKLSLEEEVYSLKNKYNTGNEKGYLVELNDKAYLKERPIGFYRNTYIITDNAFEAVLYDDLELARKDANNFGGRVLQHKPNLEVVK
ncbi:hypothetical protein LDE09_001928 [Staphylococcus pseudintermedius]|nr:hypothetical protein [Staphylococcus pseudintermedius]EIE3637743.1 hypothetical protein [Staphylococcus pseudintermedius]